MAKEITPQEGNPEQQNKETVQTEKTVEQTIPYDRFKEVLDKSKKLEDKLKKIEIANDAATKQREEETLKAKNDFEGLTKLHQTEHEKAINAAKSLIVKNYLTTLAVKHGLNDPNDITLFNTEIELDENYAIKNGDAIEKAFEDFKTKKTYLFKTEDGKPVPKTDNSPYKKIDTDKDKGFSNIDLIKKALNMSAQ